MSITRRQFVGGAAAVAAASAVPVFTSAAPAMATPTVTFPLPTPTAAAGWTPLDAKAAARYALEIYRGKYSATSGAG